MSEHQFDNWDCHQTNFDDDRKVTAAHKLRALQILQNYQQNSFSRYYSVNTLKQSIIHRFNLSDCSTIENYLQFLENSEAEKKSLYNSLIPSRKQFFSDGINWESLATHIIPQLSLEVPIEEVIRCWVPGCGTGEETYSLAILLSEVISATIPSRRFNIFATDINNSSLKTASQGIYSQEITKKVSSERLKQYFVPRNNNYVVSSKLRGNHSIRSSQYI